MTFLCAYCLGDGWVVVKLRPEGSGFAEELGPCCYCDTGKLLEFPAPDAKGNSKVGPWGAGGYWQGRPVDLSPIATDKVGSFTGPPEELKALLGIGLKEAA